MIVALLFYELSIWIDFMTNLNTEVELPSATTSHKGPSNRY